MTLCKTRRTSAAIFMLFLILDASNAYSQAKVSGHLIASSLGRTNQIEVRLVDDNGVVQSRAYTNDDGGYEFPNVKLGTYFAEVKLDGFEDARERLDLSSAGSYLVNLALNRKPDPNATPDPDAVARAKYPKKIMDDYDKALDDSRKGNTAKAAERLEGVIKAAPDFYGAHNSLANAYMNLKRNDDAEREYKRAVELNAQASDPLINLGTLYIQKADAHASEGPAVLSPIVKSAYDALDAAIKLNPKSAAAHLMLGTLDYRTGSMGDAETNLLEALTIDSHLGSAHLTLANVYNRQQKYQNALEQLDAFLIQNPKDPQHDQIQKSRDATAEKLKAAGGK